MLARKDDIEVALVVIIAEIGVAMNTAYVNDYGAEVKNFGIAGANETGVLILREEAEQVDSQGFVSVEVAIMSAYG